MKSALRFGRNRVCSCQRREGAEPMIWFTFQFLKQQRQHFGTHINNRLKSRVVCQAIAGRMRAPLALPLIRLFHESLNQVGSDIGIVR